MLLDEKAYIAELERQNTEMLYAFDAMRQRYKAAEATGRAAVRALALVAADYRAMALIDVFEAYRIMELLATDTAKAWLEEGQE